MRVISIGDLVLDYYYKDNYLIGVDGGMSSHNIAVNLSGLGQDCYVFGACGNDIAGDIALASLNKLGVNTQNVKRIGDIKTRRFHISFSDNAQFVSEKKCPVCRKKEWYENSMINTYEILENIGKDDLLLFDNLNDKNQYIIDNTLNIKMLDLGQYYDLDCYSDVALLSKIKSKFKIININERVEKYLLERFKCTETVDLFALFHADLVIITRGVKGASFLYDGNVLQYKLEEVTEEVDSNGCGDAFFSLFIHNYIKNNFIIDEEYIRESFLQATHLTNLVVSKIGARGHLHSLNKIDKKDVCLCKDFTLLKRKRVKRCNININHLESRVIKAIHSPAREFVESFDFKNKNILFVGTGGSFAASKFASIVINDLYGTNAFSLYPRDVLYRNNCMIDNVFLFSYSGTTHDLYNSVKEFNNKCKYVITKGCVDIVNKKTGLEKSNILSYRTNVNKGSERGFLSFEGALSPAALFLCKYILEKKLSVDVDCFISDSMHYWKEYFNRYFKENKKILKSKLILGTVLNVFSGDYTISASYDFESKIVESGIFHVLVHEKKNFSHGRFINYENLGSKINIYFKTLDTSKYERSLLDYLKHDLTIVLESKYNGILAEFDLLIASQYLVYALANFLDIDFSKPTYSEEAMKIYFYKGDII